MDCQSGCRIKVLPEKGWIWLGFVCFIRKLRLAKKLIVSRVTEVMNL